MSKAKIPVAEAANNSSKFPVKNRKTSVRATAVKRSKKAPKKTAARKKSGQKKVRDSSAKGAQAKHSQAESAAAGATLEDARQTSEQILGANPVVGFDGREVLGAINGLFRLMAVRPDLVIREQLGLLKELTQVAIGDSVVAPDPEDRRFRHEIWQKSPFFKRVMQSYLAWRKSLFNILDSSNASDREKERARFALGLFTEAVAPTNTLAGQPGRD